MSACHLSAVRIGEGVFSTGGIVAGADGVCLPEDREGLVLLAAIRVRERDGVGVAALGGGEDAARVVVESGKGDRSIYGVMATV